MIYDVIIIGAGASGLMAAKQLKNKNVLILEKNSKAGKKLLLTGGGRCNLTNLKDNKSFLDEINHNKKYLYSTINTFSAYDIYDYFNKYIELKEEDNNRIFPSSDKALDIIKILLNGLKINYNEEVIKIKTGIINEVETKKDTYRAKNIIIATGGCSYPKTGSTGDNIVFAKMINQPYIDLYPVETSLILKENLSLAGTSIEDVIIKYNNKTSRGNLMFTHKGLSGHSVMNISSYFHEYDNKDIYIDLIPNKNTKELEDEMFCEKDKELLTFLEKYFSKRFSTYLLNKYNINSMKIKSMKKIELINLINNIKNIEFEVLSLAPIEEAYVTGGGIDLNYINTKTFESKLYKGIYFIGEALDIYGPIGGYNLTLAFSTAYSAALDINKK